MANFEIFNVFEKQPENSEPVVTADGVRCFRSADESDEEGIGSWNDADDDDFSDDLTDLIHWSYDIRAMDELYEKDKEYKEKNKILDN